MRTIRRLIEAKRIEREENGDAGFSLIELIIVVVILGILAAVAIPIFLNIQGQAKDNSVQTVAANGASQAAAALAQDDDPSAAGFFDNLATTGTDAISLGYSVTDTTKPLDSFCVTAYGGGSKFTSAAPAKSGPGC